MADPELEPDSEPEPEPELAAPIMSVVRTAAPPSRETAVPATPLSAPCRAERRRECGQPACAGLEGGGFVIKDILDGFTTSELDPFLIWHELPLLPIR